jgi:hypothetical protein
MSARAAVWVVSSPRSTLFAELEARLEGRARLVRADRPPQVGAVDGIDTVIIDLDQPPAPLDPLEVLSLHGRLDISLLRCSRATVTHPGWVRVARHANVTLLECDPMDRANALDHLAAVLLQRLGTWDAVALGALVLAREPALSAAAPLIRAICARPWGIRRPRDLAASDGMTMSGLKRLLGRLGFNRVEHFIVYVRYVLFEQLAAREVPLATARRLAGIGDRSNLRRQLLRAHRGSPRALRSIRPDGEGLRRAG